MPIAGKKDAHTSITILHINNKKKRGTKKGGTKKKRMHTPQ